MTPGGQDRLAQRNGDIWRAYAAGHNQEWIAARFGLCQSRVSQIIAEVRDAIPDAERDDWRLRAMETLLEMHAAAVEIMRADAPPLVCQGQVVQDSDGQVVRDSAAQVATTLAAVSQVLRIQERAARQLGTDAAEKVQVTGSVRYTINGVDPDALR